MTIRGKKTTANGHAEDSRNRNRHISKSGGIKVTGIVILLLCVTIGLIAFFASSNSSEPIHNADYLSTISCQEESPAVENNYACSMSDCTFDTLLCSEGCPFGFSNDDSGCPRDCTCADEGIFEGDIMFDEDDLPNLIEKYGYMSAEDDFSTFSGSATAYDKYLWRNYLVDGYYHIKYQIASDVHPNAVKNLGEAIARFHDKTCLRFQKVNELHQHGIIFKDASHCYSPIGRAFYKDHTRIGTPNFCSVTTMQHEILHALGFYHEQSRPDRDAYVELFYENMFKQFEYNFRKMDGSKVRSLRSEYDIKSMLHYNELAFSKNWKTTIKSRSGGRLGSTDFSTSDLYELNALYSCSGHKSKPTVTLPTVTLSTVTLPTTTLPTTTLPVPPKWSEWMNWSNCDVTCGKGKKNRFRKCQDKSGANAAGCVGSATEQVDCDSSPCPSIWGEWTTYRPCSRTCGVGYQYRTRKCLGSQCPGRDISAKRCIRESCRRDAMWGSWTNWNRCYRTCGIATISRVRFCKNSAGRTVYSCESSSRSRYREIETKDCNLPSCQSLIANWGPWSSCSATCEGRRTRHCAGMACSTKQESLNCATRPCKEPDIFSKTRRNLNVAGVCNAAFTMEDWVFGDFNGDSRMDIVCSDTYGIYHLSHGSTTGFNRVWSGPFENCDEEGKVFKVDVNGDGKDDLICNSQDEGILYVKYASDRSFEEGVTEGGTFCTEYSSKLTTMTYIRKKGLLCHYRNNRVEIIFTKG